MLQRIQKAFVEEITKIAFGFPGMPQPMPMLPSARPPVFQTARPMAPSVPPPRPQIPVVGAATGSGALASGLMGKR